MSTVRISWIQSKWCDTHMQRLTAWNIEQFVGVKCNAPHCQTRPSLLTTTTVVSYSHVAQCFLSMNYSVHL